MAAIEELWEATYLPATLLNFQEEDAQDSPVGPDDDSSLSEEDYVEMFTEIPSSEDFLDLEEITEETEENSNVTYVYEQDMVNALNSALNSALANYNINQTTSLEDFCPVDVAHTWDSWVEDVAVEEEISQLESEIQSLEEELELIRQKKSSFCANTYTSSNLFSLSFIDSPLDRQSPVPSPTLSYKRKFEEEESYSEEEEEEEEIEEESALSSEEEEEEEEDSSSESECSSSEDESSSEDSSSESDNSSSSSSDDSEEDSERTIYIPYKRRKRYSFNRNRITRIESEDIDCEEDVDILN